MIELICLIRGTVRWDRAALASRFTLRHNKLLLCKIIRTQEVLIATAHAHYPVGAAWWRRLAAYCLWKGDDPLASIATRGPALAAV